MNFALNLLKKEEIANTPSNPWLNSKRSDWNVCLLLARSQTSCSTFAHPMKSKACPILRAITLYALHYFVPRNTESSSQTGGHIDRWRVLPRLNHLHIAATDISLLGKLLLGQICSITQAADILAKSSIFRLAHPCMI
jgi:hypothetical protein